MEAALRTAYEIITGREVPFKDLNITAVRGMDGVRVASVPIDDCKEELSFLNGVELKCAVAHGLVNARKLMNAVKSGELQVHFIEVMACPGGCIGGGGQPYPPEGYYVLDKEVNKKRAQSLYNIDEAKKVRKSHENPFIQKLYEEFLDEPGSDKAHHLLHTTYTPREPKGIK